MKMLNQYTDNGPKSTSSKEIIARVRKLRWAGMDDEAERLLKELEQQLATDLAGESVLPTRLETD
jgi:hypothetical protein